MTKLVRWCILTFAAALLGVALPLASAWACDPCPAPKPNGDYGVEIPTERP